jgi:arylsulfatase A-like enzyme
MNADSAHAVPRPGLLARRRALRSQLAAEPWTFGCACAIAIAGLTLLGRAAMLGRSLWGDHLQGLGPAHLLWIAPELGHDLVAAGALGLSIGGLTRVLPRRARWLGRLFGHLLLALGGAIVIVSLPLHAALQTTLQLTQLILAGGARDLAESALGIVPLLGWLGALAAIALTWFSLPFLGGFALRRFGRRRWPSLMAAGLLGALLSGVEVFAPEEGAQPLQTSAVYEFAASIGRFGLRRRAPAVDMSRAPHFARSLMFGTPAPAQPTESLLDVSRLPLKRANVVLIVLESAAVRHTGLWNGKPGDTPRLAEIAQTGLTFDEYYTATPVSMKSLFSISCSSYPHTAPPAETYTNPSIDCLSLSELLKEQGYRTGLFHGGRFSYTRKDAFFRQRRYDVLRDAGALQHRDRYPKVAWGADDRAVIDDALHWLEGGNRSSPFFLHLIFLAPHEPYVVNGTPEPFGTATKLDRYRNATLFIDSQVGRVWDWVKAQGKLEQTLFVIVGDHGEAFGEHPGDVLHGGRIYDTTMRSPLLLANPQLFSGKRSDRVGNHVDLTPTVLDLLGMPKPPRHQGHSLLRGYQPHMIYFFADWQRHYLGLRDGQWKYIYNVDRERHELYDVGRDRLEQRNLAYGRTGQVEAYAKRALEFERFYQELIPNYERYLDGKNACAGKTVCYLDELKPVLQHGTLRKNKSAGGHKLSIGGTSYERGLGVTPLSILRYNIRGDGYRRLKGAVGHHSMGGPANLSLKVSAQIFLDDALIWSSGKMTADDPPKQFELSIEGGAVLELVGYDIDAEDWRDYIDWGDVRIER